MIVSKEQALAYTKGGWGGVCGNVPGSPVAGSYQNIIIY